MRDADPAHVSLVDVDEAVLEELVAVATIDAAANEVTPPLTGGDIWDDARVGWLRAFHRDRRAGLDGPHQESTWAVVVAGRVVGSVRLQRTAQPGVLETGLWLAEHARRKGIGTAAAAAVARRATAAGARAVTAVTTSPNHAALALLARAGFTLSADADGLVRADLVTPASA